MDERERRRRDREKKKLAVLARFGVSAIEYDAMICPHYGIFVPPREMASHTVSEHQGYSPYTADEYLPIIYKMIEKGWFCLAKKELRRQPDVRDATPTSEWDWGPPGTVMFTRKGYLLHRRIYLALYGRRSLQEHDSFRNFREKARQVHYYASTKELCLEFIHNLRQVSAESGNISAVLSRPAKVTRVCGPERIGKWKPSRHLTLRSGYRVIVHYKTLRRRRIRMPELDLDATVECFEPIFISGRIAGKPFSFGESISHNGVPFDDRNAFFTWSFQVEGQITRREEPGSVLSGEKHAAGAWIIPHYLYELEEDPPHQRRWMLTAPQAKKTLASCARKYLDQRAKAQ